VNKAELIEALAQHYDGSRAEATKALNAVVQTITYSAAAGEKVAITGFGVFEKVDRPARMVRNPRTGERKEAAATSVPRFRAGTELKAYVSGERAVPRAGAPTSSVRASARRAEAPTSEAPATAATASAAPSAPATAAKVEPAKIMSAPKKKDSKKDAKKAVSVKKGKPAKKKDGKKSKSGK
jgi:DNA-binding protein HU-beta